jgi:hypothetical protein
MSNGSEGEHRHELEEWVNRQKLQDKWERLRDLSRCDDQAVVEWMVMSEEKEAEARAEFLRRQTGLQREATDAAKQAAKAAADTAAYTRRNANYVLISVIILAISAVVTTVVTIFAHH